MHEETWTDDGSIGYDAERYDPEEPGICQVCGADGVGAGDRSTAGMYCPECDAHIWIR